MTRPLDAYEQWCVRSNLAHIAAGEDASTVVAILRANGYERVASAVEEAASEEAPSTD